MGRSGEIFFGEGGKNNTLQQETVLVGKKKEVPLKGAEKCGQSQFEGGK